MISIKDKKKYREHMSNDFICGYLSAISDMSGKITTIKAAFDLEAYQIRASQKIERKTRKKSNKSLHIDRQTNGGE